MNNSGGNSTDDSELRNTGELSREDSNVQNYRLNSSNNTDSTRESSNANGNPLENEINSTNDNTLETENNNSQGSENPNESDNDNRNEMNIFDRFMDTILGNRNRLQSPVAIPIISAPGNDTSALISTTADASGPTTQAGPTPGSTNSNAVSTSTDSNGGAIVITVNYVFSDENNPQSPNRTGSLVMTLPNNSSNRDPRIIQEFIRLATLMAYSTIVNLNKEKGITIDKFNSFNIKSLEELKDTSRECSICFEDYIALSDNNSGKKRHIAEGTKSEGDIFLKKRKLNSESTSNTPASTPVSSSTSTHSSSGERSSSGPKYLSEFTGIFEHLPVQMPCGHIFGKSCLFEWLKNHSSCPLCRDSVKEPNDNEAPTTEGNNNEQNQNPNITMIHRPGLLDIFNSFSRDRESATPVRRILRSGNGLGEENSSNTHMHAHSFPSQLTDLHGTPQNGESTNQSGVFSHLLNYLRRSQLSENSEPLFPAGVSSRRTTNGVETRLTDRIDSDDNVLEFVNLRSLVDENGNDNNNATANNNNSNNNGNDSNSNGNVNNNTSNNDDEN